MVWYIGRIQAHSLSMYEYLQYEYVRVLCKSAPVFIYPVPPMHWSMVECCPMHIVMFFSHSSLYSKVCLEILQKILTQLPSLLAIVVRFGSKQTSVGRSNLNRSWSPHLRQEDFQSTEWNQMRNLSGSRNENNEMHWMIFDAWASTTLKIVCPHTTSDCL